MSLIEAKQIEVATWITHRYHSLEALSQAFTTDHQANDYIKGVFVLSCSASSFIG
ncbi:MAG: hypothetical protein DSM106950_44375 [Stigonema ocellatum SAG 48.90 = DSM 106950]|nr:hypothetical protein [Stigonema ocellatum SAG 48.90 = DSM 106950]